jgi:PAS domain-containing protein
MIVPATDPAALRAGLLLFAFIAAFGFGWLAIRRLRRNLAPEFESLGQAPLPAEGLPVHAYQAVIQQLKQQKHVLSAQHLSERRKAKASDALSTAILSNLSCGVLFFNSSGLVRQANSAARQLLGFASPVGLHAADLFLTATLRPETGAAQSTSDPDPSPGSAHFAPGSPASVGQALAPTLAGKAALRGLLINYFSREGENRVLELAASPVLAEDASLMGTTVVITDKTDIERIRHEQRQREEVSSELALELSNSKSRISEYARQLSLSRDPELRPLAAGIAAEAEALNRTMSSFLGQAKARPATTT